MAVVIVQIVDLIRADLMSVCVPSSVQVPKLIKIESYDHVHMLVTTVVGQLGSNVGTVEALGRCFPPGELLYLPRGPTHVRGCSTSDIRLTFHFFRPT